MNIIEFLISYKINKQIYTLYIILGNSYIYKNHEFL
jgi:hypothetical protein